MARNALWLDIQDQLVAERAGTREAAASDLVGDMNGSLVASSHTQHEAQTLVRPATDAYEGEAQQGGGASDDVEVWVFTAEGLPYMDVEATLAMQEQLAEPRLTWLERIAKRWPVRVS